MITTKKGKTLVNAKGAEELCADMLSIITTFVAYSKSLGMPEIVIEQTLVRMVADGFELAEETEEDE